MEENREETRGRTPAGSALSLDTGCAFGYI